MPLPKRLLLALGVAAACAVNPARAEVKEVRIAQQPGLSYLAYVVMEHEQLLEKHAKAAGLGEVKIVWFKFSGGNVMNDALLSGSLDIANSGPVPVITMWAATRNTLKVKGIGAYNALPNILVVRNPDVKSIRDFTDKDRIAVPAVRVSNPALFLQMESEKLFGPGNHNKLDPLTVSRGHPDAMAQMLQKGGEITAHFSTLPYVGIALKTPGVHVILTGQQAIGGPVTSGLAYTTTKFHDENPKTFGAFFAALKSAIDFINARPREAVEIYLKVTREKTTVDEVMADLKPLNDPYDIAPQSVMKIAEFLYRTGSVKERPASWKDLFFPEAHGLPGS
ncbi:MAG TPA: ABC transporter substrate-binding protein [Burkholderiales bacterium]|nr:ABC transporter substrate-binding protein [Burkholderiales bacterium]